MTKNRILISCLLLIFAGASAIAGAKAAGTDLRQALSSTRLAGVFDDRTPDHVVDKFTTVFNQQGETLTMMARLVFVGDEIYTADGQRYRIEKVEAGRAEAKFMGMDPKIAEYNEFYASQGMAVSKDLAQAQKNLVAIYHTHSSESYVPTDGKEAIPFRGGIYQVGERFNQRLEKRNLQVEYDESPHCPHDNNAYVRSRRTAVKLLKNNPAAIFDVHRDGVPDPSFYRTTIGGEQVAQIRIVVGRQNPRSEANMDFGRRMMAAANNIHPKLVKEIFVGRGDYNQDLSPRALLLEAGTHTLSREKAERGIEMFADAVPAVLGVSPAAEARPGGGVWRTLGWLLGLTVIGGLGFLLISSGSWEKARERLAGYSREITGFLDFRKLTSRKPGRPDEEGTGEGRDNNQG